VKGVQTVYGLSIRREIHFPAGTDVQVRIVRPSILKQKEQWHGWRTMQVTSELQHLVSAAPLLTHTARLRVSSIRWSFRELEEAILVDLGYEALTRHLWPLIIRRLALWQVDFHGVHVVVGNLLQQVRNAV
jgi:hypothetical protein